MPEYIRGGAAAFYQPAGHQQSDFPSGAESEHHSVSAFLQRGQADGNRGNPFPAGGKRLRRHLPGGGTAAKGAGAGNGASFHRRKLNFVQICTASLSQPFYQGKSAYPDLHFLPVHLSDHGGVGKGTVDIGLIGENERMEKLVFYPVQEIEDIFVCTRRYLENLCKRVSFPGKPSAGDLISHATLMLLDKENITRQYMDKYLFSEGISAAQILEVTSMDLLIDFAKIDLGIACVIESFVREELESGRLIRLAMPVSVPVRKVGFAYIKNTAFSSTAGKFMDFYMECCEGNGKL